MSKAQPPLFPGLPRPSNSLCAESSFTPEGEVQNSAVIGVESGRYDNSLIYRSSGSTAGSTPSCWRRGKQRLLGISSCMALPFLVIMIIEALVISKCTTSLTTAAVMSTWKAAQTSTIQFINGMVAIESERMYNMGVTIGALYSNQTMTFGDATLMQVMCALLANYDVNVLYRAAVIVSTESNEIAIGTHGDVKSVSVSQLAGGFSVDHTIDALYLVDPSQAYNFVKPPVIYETTMQPNVTVTIGNRTLGNPLFTAFQEYLDGNIPEVPRRLYWSPMPELLNLILFTYPIIMHETSDDEYERNGQGFVDIRMEAANLCSLMRMHMSSGARLMALMTQSVEQERPIILSNSWEQPVVNDTGVWSINFGYRPVSYLHVDEIHDDLMHSALRHISLPDLAQENFSTMVEFAWSGGPALVSAWQYITPFGMQASMVLVHPLKIISPSTILRLALSTLIAALVGALVCSVAFWTFMEWGISRRLRDIAASMALCADTHGGEMDLPLRTQRTCLGLREVEKLAAVQVEAMARLVNARKYLPAHVACYSPNAQTGPFRSDSESRSSPCSQLRLADDSTVGPAALDMLAKSLRPALLSVVYVRFDQLLESSIAHNRHAHITPLHRMGLQSSSHLKLRRIHASIDQPRHDWIPSPSVVERFLRLTMEYASKHHGVIHQLSPDCCVVIFAEDDAVAHHVEGRRAAMAAVRFALALQGQLLQPRSEIPPVSILVDTNRFDCSSHYSEVLDRKFFVASGRDVNDDVGYVLPLIGVKVGLTEETAVLVQHAVRVLPLEALYVGRPEHSEYTLVLYEALPGPTNQTSWQHFQSCFYQAFLCMTAGKYSEALALFDEAAAVEGLEAELLPASLRSEGQQLRFTCVGDTLSEAWTCMQLDRLTSVCAQHVIMRDGERYVRHPLSEDFLQLLHRHPAAATRSEAASVTSVTSVGGTRPPVEVIDEVAIRQSRLTLLRAERDPLYDRYIAEVPGTKLRYTHSCPDFLIDNHGNRWTLSKEPLKKVNEPMVNRKYLGMSHTGAVAVLYIIPYRVEKSTSPLLADLPLGRLESPLVPMRQKTEEQLRAAELVLTAPCISVEGFVFTVGILGYTNAVEGGIVVVEEYCPGGNIPEMLDRFHRDIPPRAIEGNFPVGLKGLALLHSRGLIHGHIRPEELSVGISGIGRLKGVFADYNMANRLLMLPLSCYVSPEVAAGALPTAKSDVFGLALTVVAAMTAKAPWRWAANQHRATEAQLQELLAGARTVTGHRHFCAELCAGHLQIAPLIPRSGGELKAEMHTVLLQCLNFDPQQRPTAAEALAMLAPSS